MNKAFQKIVKYDLQIGLIFFPKKILPETHPETGFYHEKKFLLNQEYYL